MPSLDSPMYSPYVFDRTNILFVSPNMEPMLPLGQTGYRHSLADTCDERAQEIISNAQNKKIYVFWSGGIDSTTALVSLLKAGADHLLCLVMTEESIQEYSEFYSRYIYNKLEIKLVKYNNMYAVPESIDKYLKDGIVVTGEIGDQMFGSDKYLAYADTSKLLEPWEDSLKNTKTFEKYKRFVDACPIKIKTQKDFWWWFNYAIKYNYVIFRMLRTSRKFKLETNVFHFFNTTSFNNWCFSTPTEEKFFGSDIKNYKQPLKDYIYNFTKDSDYQKNKIKTGSLRYVYFDLNPFARFNEWDSFSVDGVIA